MVSSRTIITSNATSAFPFARALSSLVQTDRWRLPFTGTLRLVRDLHDLSDLIEKHVRQGVPFLMGPDV